MTRIIMHGCNGHMGQVITGIVANDANAQIVAGIDLRDDGHNSYPVFASLEECNVEADVIIDFASAKAEDTLVDYIKKTKIPAVICTTGLSDEQIASINEASKSVAILRSANMSLGINTLFKLLQDAAKVFASAGFDIEIVEKHHNLKKDAPSGTAIMIAEAINEELGNKMHYVYDRHSVRKPREKTEIGMHSIRGGTIVGEHDVIFAGRDEVITLSHSAGSKQVFAVGSVNAAVFLSGCEKGLYQMSDLLSEA